MGRIAALSIWQPWADLIAQGKKTIETRIWFTTYKGPTLICSSKITRDNEIHILSAIEEYQQLPVCQGLGRTEPLLPHNYKPQFGVALAIADLYQCRKLTKKDGYEACMEDPTDKYGFFFRNITPVPAMEIRGKPGFFEVEIPEEFDHLIQAIEKNYEKIIPPEPFKSPDRRKDRTHHAKEEQALPSKSPELLSVSKPSPKKDAQLTLFQLLTGKDNHE